MQTLSRWMSGKPAEAKPDPMGGEGLDRGLEDAGERVDPDAPGDVDAAVVPGDVADSSAARRRAPAVEAQ